MNSNRLLLLHFAATIFLSAFLLFAIQPMFAKMVLPTLGGAPGVWSVAMVFFQALLLLGYLYAHLLVRYVPIKLSVMIHCIVTAFAFVSLPITMASGFEKPPADNGEIFWLISLFTTSIGLPFFALSANGPLMQAWFARSGHPQAEDPYFLYSGSNIGSLLALLCYPLLFEPNLTLGQQATNWSLGYTILLCLLVLLAFVFLVRKRIVTVDRRAAATEIVWTTRARWTGLALVPSALLIAVTAHISTDVAAVPFLWIVPLVLYLLTFIIAFSRRPLISQTLLIHVLPFAVAPLLLLLVSGYFLPWPATLFIHLFGFFALAMLCHGRLAAMRPQASQLTEFYFFLSLGGVIGGLLAGLVAPNVFNAVIEYPLFVVAALLALPGLKEDFEKGWHRDAVIAAVTLVLAGGIGLAMKGQVNQKIIWVVVLTIVGAVLIADRRRPLRFAFLAAGALLLSPLLRNDGAYAFTKRSFFGVHKVYDNADGKFRVLEHGTTIHGAQSKVTGMEREPLTYYGKANNFGQTMRALRLLHPLQHIGAIGLGTGSMACHVEPGEDITFFEIDKTVAGLASNEFSFLKNCAPSARIVLGDARLTLKEESDGKFDFLIIDAFTSDAVPVHLLTMEAINLYFSKLKPNGAVLLHISNRNLEMESMLASSAHDLGLVGFARSEPPDEEKWKMMIAPSHVVVMAHRAEDLGGLPSQEGWRRLEPNGVTAWRDDFSDIFGAMWRRLNEPRYPEGAK